MCALKECLNRKIKRGKSTTHVEFEERRMLHDEMNVEIIESGLCSWVPNMWKSDHPIVNIATVDNIQSTKERGAKLRDAFCLRFTTDTQKETYFDKITKEPVMTFEKMKTKEKSPSVEEDEGKSFADIIMNFNEFKLDLSYLLQWPITSKHGHFRQTISIYCKTISSSKQSINICTS